MAVGVSSIALRVDVGVAVAAGAADAIGLGKLLVCATVLGPDNNTAPAIVAITIALSASPWINCLNRLDVFT